MQLEPEEEAEDIVRGEEYKRWEDVAEYRLESWWGLLADFTIPYMVRSTEKPDGKDE